MCYACTQPAPADCDGIYMRTVYLYSCIFMESAAVWLLRDVFCPLHRADANPLIFTALLQQIHLNPFSS